MYNRESKSHKISTPFLRFEICDYFEDCFFLFRVSSWWKYLLYPKCAPNVICKSGSLFNLLICVFCYNIFFYLAVTKRNNFKWEVFTYCISNYIGREILSFANIFPLWSFHKPQNVHLLMNPIEVVSISRSRLLFISTKYARKNCGQFLETFKLYDYLVCHWLLQLDTIKW